MFAVHSEKHITGHFRIRFTASGSVLQCKVAVSVKEPDGRTTQYHSWREARDADLQLAECQAFLNCESAFPKCANWEGY